MQLSWNIKMEHKKIEEMICVISISKFEQLIFFVSYLPEHHSVSIFFFKQI